jgi:hypothetical protein
MKQTALRIESNSVRRSFAAGRAAIAGRGEVLGGLCAAASPDFTPTPIRRVRTA